MHLVRTSLLGSLSLTLCLAIGCSGLMPGPGPADADAPTEFTETKSGLKYRVLRKSDGKQAKPSGHVRLHYIGTLDDGTVFDSSYSRGEPAIFSLQEVVPGFTEGLQLVGEGGMIELEIPPDLGYGEDGRAPTIPRNATLHFVVEVIRVF
ncbi:putative FKBP-type peptidyl-prolyl cis-trans isomerase [Stieleria maiorica]|uniref:Peptidyl-prolyl cis-trans isomerase n=1 Tax=Stieleria maiorica TaxID=2795974 RepID=A0A5B9MK53_9BACT|nr:FKBP-type peptidyl-prolyl cis-trans isomerase [Stieleria maiorica]QEG00361.1 putative FKBP-type peptidyl-prolyl cis-trans isomerase [Stieleria maiorica]